jgi:hypothetical protein
MSPVSIRNVANLGGQFATKAAARATPAAERSLAGRHVNRHSSFCSQAPPAGIRERGVILFLKVAVRLDASKTNSQLCSPAN